MINLCENAGNEITGINERQIILRLYSIDSSVAFCEKPHVTCYIKMRNVATELTVKNTESKVHSRIFASELAAPLVMAVHRRR